MGQILITGVTGGIGHATAAYLLQRGETVTGIARTETDDTAGLLAAYPETFRLHLFDLSQTEGIDALVKGLTEDDGPVGGLVHCAGFDKVAPLHLIKETDAEALWRIHALAPMLFTAAMSKKRRFTEESAIVLLSSVAAGEGAMGHAAYASAKGAVEGFLAPAAAELAEKKIRINVVRPGVVRTRMSAGWMDHLTKEQYAALEAGYPFGFGETEDIAATIAFLLSPAARMITGQIITADGGHSIRKV